ncbi:cytochrome c family protein [Marinomonas sp. MED121]|uniref:c-type cytochrome n=1 Tax=Marinomonas sp. MED121 TaxID=314277 RepID=UPI0000691173|nr:c-type cytochrome [Marinomonas sp. MED121]EAQ67389.1 cytochrome c family protein [Marinomonas sp. MED121]
MKLRLWITTLVVACLPFAVNAADIEAGKAKAAVCAACHGANGYAAIPTYPHLAGQNPAYIELSLKAYKSGQRTGGQAAIMAGMAAPLSDDDIKNLAAYFGSLK